MQLHDPMAFHGPDTAYLFLPADSPFLGYVLLNTPNLRAGHLVRGDAFEHPCLPHPHTPHPPPHTHPHPHLAPTTPPLPAACPHTYSCYSYTWTCMGRWPSTATHSTFLTLPLLNYRLEQMDAYLSAASANGAGGREHFREPPGRQAGVGCCSEHLAHLPPGRERLLCLGQTTCSDGRAT